MDEPLPQKFPILTSNIRCYRDIMDSDKVADDLDKEGFWRSAIELRFAIRMHAIRMIKDDHTNKLRSSFPAE